MIITRNIALHWMYNNYNIEKDIIFIYQDCKIDDVD